MPNLPAHVVAALPPRTRLRWKREEARSVVAAYEASGLSLEKFASREGFKPERVERWTRKLKVGTAPKAPKFVELQPMRVGLRGAPIEIVLRSGHILFVAESVDPTALRRVMDLLERDADC